MFVNRESLKNTKKYKRYGKYAPQILHSRVKSGRSGFQSIVEIPLPAVRAAGKFADSATE